MFTRSQALARALARVGTACVPGSCWATTRSWYAAPAIGDYDGDGRADAEDAWKAAKKRHPGDRNPPPGVPVFWSGGRRDDGHAAIAAPDGQIVSTDAPETGVIGLVDLTYPERAWGLTYLGWTEDIYGDPIPVSQPPRPTRPKRIQRYLAETKTEIDRLRKGRAAALARGEKPEPWTALIKAQRAVRQRAKSEWPT